MPATAELPYRKDMSGVDWAEVYGRQVQRAGLAEAWLEGLGLKPGTRVLDVGCGPGYFSLLLAERVGPSGVVYAVDRSPDALAHLDALQRERGIAHIQRIVADGAAVELPDGPVDAALVTMMLHHADDPPGLLTNVAHLLRPGGRAVVAEFHPDGPGELGPPPGERIAPELARRWCEAAGLTVLAEERQTRDHYLLCCQRPA